VKHYCFTWWKLIADAVSETGDAVVASTMSDAKMDEPFQQFSYLGAAAFQFTAWGERYVYFPVQYDGTKWVGYAPRNPCDIETKHQGA
jgi:hypothetical protein